MHLIVLTAPAWRDDEAALLTAMFEQGLETLHVRKPGCTKQAMEQLLRELPTRFHNRIILHSYYELGEQYAVKGIHLSEDFRQLCPDFAREWDYHLPRHRITTSLHDIKSLQREFQEFDYVFLSPVFDSISKSGYKTPFEPDKLAQIIPASPNAVIALGGITTSNIAEVRTMGFAGCAVLGSIWEAAEPVEAFVRLRYTLWE